MLHASSALGWQHAICWSLQQHTTFVHWQDCINTMYCVQTGASVAAGLAHHAAAFTCCTAALCVQGCSTGLCSTCIWLLSRNSVYYCGLRACHVLWFCWRLFVHSQDRHMQVMCTALAVYVPFCARFAVYCHTYSSAPPQHALWC